MNRMTAHRWDALLLSAGIFISLAVGEPFAAGLLVAGLTVCAMEGGRR